MAEAGSTATAQVDMVLVEEKAPVRHLRSAVVWVLLAFTFLAATGGSAEAAVQIQSFQVFSSDSRVGMHPDLETNVSFLDAGNPETPRNIVVDLPQGMFGNPNAIPECTSVDYSLHRCPPVSQAGIVTVRGNHEGVLDNLLGTAPLYILEPRSSLETTRFAFVVPTLNIPISIPVSVRTAGDYGLRLVVSEITQQIPLAGFNLTVWGSPAAPIHNEQRFARGEPGNPSNCPKSFDADCTGAHRGAVPVVPLTINPSVCTGEPLEVDLRVETYQDPGALSVAEAQYPPTSDCEEQTFNPVLDVSVTNPSADYPTGLELQLKAPQFLGNAASPSQIRSATLTLPEGLTINPDAADGQTACPDVLARFDSEGPHECPDSSKIGTFQIESTALDGALEGSLFFGEPKPGNQYRVFMIASGFGINAKLVASVHPDPRTGRLQMDVSELPQVPFDAFKLQLFGSDRALVATPIHCAVYRMTSTFTPWNNRLSVQRSEPFISIESGPRGAPCPGPIRPFSPRLVAGMSNPVAGDFSNFTLRLDRDDGDQFLGDLTFRLPPGLSGYLRGITYCPEASIAAAAERPGRAEQASPSCPESSQVGTSNVAAGPGTHPFHAAGRMYLAGPLHDAPLSLVAVTPALAGPYDYGTVVVRVALRVDPRTAQVSAVSERVPSIIGGVPIRMRSIQVSVNRPQFMINPTNCSPFTIDSQGIGDQGTVTDFSSYFHSVNCYSLGFKPRMTVRQLGGSGQTARAKNPRLRFDLHTRPGDANLKSVSVTLPKAFAIDQRHLGNICSKAQLESERCAGRQPIGHAWVKSPLLDAPLQGPAYAVSGFGKLPRVAFVLAGQVTIVPEAESRSVKGGFLQTTVPVIPDAPVGHFRLTLLGGSKGYLVNTRNLCSAGATTTVRYVAQSGKRLSQRVRTRTACGKGRKGASRSHRRR